MERLPEYGRRRWRRSGQGVVLGAGAAAGWAVLSGLLGLWDDAGPVYQVWLYGYMTVGSMAAFGAFGFFAGVHEERFAEMSLVDHLTRAYNTRSFHEALRGEFANAKRHNRPLSIILLDLDHFKQINDTFGHQAGDEVLRAVASTVSDYIREGDTLYRVGGEEFAVLMPETPASGGMALAERIREAVREKPVVIGKSERVNVRMSLGVAGTDRIQAETSTELFASVDHALYEAKEGGRDRSVMAEDIHFGDSTEVWVEGGWGGG
ncbi:GGDEF domain-containing protein [Desulfohalovibrio reitneri]|uniref:GGDEF domain-containing protein n=1 Tax=Desulfohalovibrio reitneri TaxID=1307759 RepID=UPI00068C32CD|nr:GGDEF domain-containing protein [Desulfohalovibrio reitneri]